MGTWELHFDSICISNEKDEVIHQTWQLRQIDDFLADVKRELLKGNFYKMIIEKDENI